MVDIEKLRMSAKLLGDMLLNKFKVELEGQGHILEGNLLNSLEMGVESRVGGFTLSFMGLAYGIDLNEGKKAEDIPSKGSERYRELLREMSRYVEKRMGVSGGLSFRIGKNIIEKWRVEGMPTKRSYRFSKNGRRLGWINYVLENQKKDIDELVEDILGICLIDLIESDFLELNKNV